jgi:hypothetical protein
MQFNDKFNVQFQGEAIFGNLERKTIILFSRSRDEYVVKRKTYFFSSGNNLFNTKLSKLQCFGYQYFKDRVVYTRYVLKMEYRFSNV